MEAKVTPHGKVKVHLVMCSEAYKDLGLNFPEAGCSSVWMSQIQELRWLLQVWMFCEDWGFRNMI